MDSPISRKLYYYITKYRAEKWHWSLFLKILLILLRKLTGSFYFVEWDTSLLWEARAFVPVPVEVVTNIMASRT